MNSKLISAISLCRKAGKLKMGFDVVKEEVKYGNADAVLLCSDLSERSQQQMQYICQENQVPVARLPVTMEELWSVAGRKCGIFAVEDRGFCKMICSLWSPEDNPQDSKMKK